MSTAANPPRFALRETVRLRYMVQWEDFAFEAESQRDWWQSLISTAKTESTLKTPIKCFERANVVVFSDYAMAMMNSVFNSGNFFVIPGSPKETWEVEHLMALNRKEDLLSKLSFKSDDFVIVVVGSQFSYTGIWRERALVMQATMHLMASYQF